MSIVIIAIAAESGVPIFSRKRGSNDNIQFSTIASLHGINMFSKCHSTSMVDTKVDNGTITWKEYCKSITLIGIVTGGLECDIELLLSHIYDLMIFCIGKKELENLKNIDQIKRDLRQCYPIMDYLLESLDPNTIPQTTIILDLIQSILCPQAQQLQVLDVYAEKVTGRWACLSIRGHLVATSSDFCELDSREATLLLLLASAQNGAPLRDTLIYLPQMSPNVAFRAVTCKLLADVYVLVVCGASPPLPEIDEIVLQCWEGYAQIIKEAKLVYPRNFPLSITFEPVLLGILFVNIAKRRCVFSRHLQQSNQKIRTMSGTHRVDILRTFYITTAKGLAPELHNRSTEEESKQLMYIFDNYLQIDITILMAADSQNMSAAEHGPPPENTAGHADALAGMSETYWCSEYHKCHAQRSGEYLCCALYAPSVHTHTMRLLTNKILQELITSKEIFW